MPVINIIVFIQNVCFYCIMLFSRKGLNKRCFYICIFNYLIIWLFYNYIFLYMTSSLHKGIHVMFFKNMSDKPSKFSCKYCCLILIWKMTLSVRRSSIEGHWKFRMSFLVQQQISYSPMSLLMRLGSAWKMYLGSNMH